MVTHLDGRIVDVTDFVHVVDGKVICFKPGTYDMSSGEAVGWLLSLAENLFETKTLPRMYGKDSVCLVLPAHDGMGGVMPCVKHADDFPEQYRHDVRRGLEYAVDRGFGFPT